MPAQSGLDEFYARNRDRDQVQKSIGKAPPDWERPGGPSVVNPYADGEARSARRAARRGIFGTRVRKRINGNPKNVRIVNGKRVVGLTDAQLSAKPWRGLNEYYEMNKGRPGIPAVTDRPPEPPKEAAPVVDNGVKSGKLEGTMVTDGADILKKSTEPNSPVVALPGTGAATATKTGQALTNGGGSLPKLGGDTLGTLHTNESNAMKSGSELAHGLGIAREMPLPKLPGTTALDRSMAPAKAGGAEAPTGASVPSPASGVVPTPSAPAAASATSAAAVSAGTKAAVAQVKPTTALDRSMAPAKAAGGVPGTIQSNGANAFKKPEDELKKVVG